MGILVFRILRFVVLGLVMGVGAAGVSAPAWATCTCSCVEGKPHAQCTTTLEKAPYCPVAVCNPNDVSDKPVTPPMSKNCTLVQVMNPDTHQIERQRVCK
jgi:hypothetical protein